MRGRERETAICAALSSLVSSNPADATIKNVLIIVVSTFNDNNNRQTQREREGEGEREGGPKYPRNKHINT